MHRIAEKITRRGTFLRWLLRGFRKQQLEARPVISEL
jgi:hypothetical protein